MAIQPAITIERPGARLLTYLDALIAEGGYGDTREAVAERLLWDGVRRAVERGWINRIPAREC